MDIPTHFPFIELGNFVVMPNHVHGMLIIDKLATPPTPGSKNENWKPGTIEVIINQYKRIVTINARKILRDFAWQSRFHDHIIRSAESFERIQSYMANNPQNWKDDTFNA